MYAYVWVSSASIIGLIGYLILSFSSQISVVQEIEDRQRFLETMGKTSGGQTQQMRNIMKGEMAQKLREMENILKSWPFRNKKFTKNVPITGEIESCDFEPPDGATLETLDKHWQNY